MAENKQICTRCNRGLKDNNIVWLELSLTDGRYWNDVPPNHDSQGCFPFGKICANKQLGMKGD